MSLEDQVQRQLEIDAALAQCPTGGMTPHKMRREIKKAKKEARKHVPPSLRKKK